MTDEEYKIKLQKMTREELKIKLQIAESRWQEELSKAPSYKYIQAHKRKFGKEPVFIGRTWLDDPKNIQLINDALIKGVPYDEYEMLNEEEKQMYNEGGLIID